MSTGASAETEADPALRASLSMDLRVGSTFTDRVRAQTATELLSARSNTGASTRWSRSEPTRLVAVCSTTFDRTKGLDKKARAAIEAELCKFTVKFKRRSADQPFECTALEHRHNCNTVNQTVRHGLSRAVIVNQLAHAVTTSERATVKPAELQSSVSSHFAHFEPNYQAIWKASVVLSSGRLGDHNEEEAMLPAYARSLLRADPRARVDLQRLKTFISPSTAPITAARCRPVICLDACHTKGPLESILMLAVTQDPNHHLCILAWAVARSEDQQTWRWFLSNLRDHMPFINSPYRVFISDRQKGLQNALDLELGQAKKAFCCLHLRDNVKTNCGKAAADFFWTLPFKKTKESFDEAFNAAIGKPELRGVTDYLAGIDLTLWARPYFGPAGRFGVVTSNAVEQCNAWLLPLRAKPVISLLHGLRDQVIEHALKMKKAADQHDEPLTPKATIIYDIELGHARERVRRHTQVYQVIPWLRGKVGNLDNLIERAVEVWDPNQDGRFVCKCECDRFIEHRILCRHALALMLRAGVQFTADQCAAHHHTTKGWREVYDDIPPMHALDDLEKDDTVVLPRVKGAGAGRRQNKRRERGVPPSQASQRYRVQNSQQNQ